MKESGGFTLGGGVALKKRVVQWTGGFMVTWGGFMLKKSGGFMIVRGVELWGRGGFTLKESGGFMMAQIKTKLLRFGPGRAHHPGTLLGGHVGLHIRGPALSLFKAVQSPRLPLPC